MSTIGALPVTTTSALVLAMSSDDDGNRVAGCFGAAGAGREIFIAGGDDWGWSAAPAAMAPRPTGSTGGGGSTEVTRYAAKAAPPTRTTSAAAWSHRRESLAR